MPMMGAVPSSSSGIKHFTMLHAYKIYILDFMTTMMQAVNSAAVVDQHGKYPLKYYCDRIKLTCPTHLMSSSIFLTSQACYTVQITQASCKAPPLGCRHCQEG